MSVPQPDNGNGKLPGQIALGMPRRCLVSGNPRLADAVRWLKARRETGHVASCQCVRCNLSRAQARDAVRYIDCDCGACARCWAEAEILAGRL
ncbi:MAG: hypothetical protein ACYTEX_27585 [Planctomycetota bacterium]|jgi:hypothetical protein